MGRKKSIAIPEVDIIKAGLNKQYKDTLSEKGLVDGNNNVILTCNDEVREMAKKSEIEKLRQKEKEFRELEKQIKEEYSMDKDDIKSESKKIEKKKKKKDKKDSKKKSKKKKKSSYEEDLLNSVPLDLSEYLKSGGDKGIKKKKKKDKKKKKKKDKQRAELGIKVKEKKKLQKDKEAEPKKKEESEVAKRFKEVEKITRENIKEIDTTLQVVDKRIKELTSSSERIRGKDTALANYFAAKTSLISTKQKAATDILSSRAKVYDIEMKKEKSAQSASSSDADILSRIFPGIALNDSKTNDIKDYISKNGKNKDKKKRKKSKSYDADVLMNREKELRKSGEIEYSDWNKNIEWEGNYNVAIKKSWKTGDWKFVAVDDDGNIMRDVPDAMLPSKNSVQVAFDDEKDKAIDKNTNTMYNVLAVPTI